MIKWHKKLGFFSPTSDPFPLIMSQMMFNILLILLQVMIRTMWGGFPLSDSIRERRLHHQWLPDVVQYENGYDQVIYTVMSLYGFFM